MAAASVAYTPDIRQKLSLFFLCESIARYKIYNLFIVPLVTLPLRLHGMFIRWKWQIESVL